MACSLEMARPRGGYRTGCRTGCHKPAPSRGRCEESKLGDGLVQMRCPRLQNVMMIQLMILIGWVRAAEPPKPGKGLVGRRDGVVSERRHLVLGY
jgi:hypothetical protein